LINDLRIQAATRAVETGGGSAVKRKLAFHEATKKVASSGVDEEMTFILESNVLGT